MLYAPEVNCCNIGVMYLVRIVGILLVFGKPGGYMKIDAALIGFNKMVYGIINQRGFETNSPFLLLEYLDALTAVKTKPRFNAGGSFPQ